LGAQLGFSDQTTTAEAESPGSSTAKLSDERIGQVRSAPRDTNPGVNTTASEVDFSSLWNQVSGDNTTPSAAGISPVKSGSGVQQAAAWNSADDPQSPASAQSPARGLWSSLAQPFIAQTTDAPARRPASSQAANNTSGADDGASQAEQVPQLLMPFYHTNDAPPASRGAAQIARTRDRNHGSDVANSVRASKLLAQLSATTDTDFRSEPSSVPDAPLRTLHDVWDGGWAVHVPYELNPLNQPTSVPESRAIGSQTLTVAYLQDATPTPEEAIPEPEKILLPDSQNSESADQPAKEETSLQTNKDNEGENGGKKKEEKLATADKLGEKPVDNSLEFLRAETVLLKPGKYQFDIGIQYQIQERNFPVLLTSGAAAPGIASIPGTHPGSVSVSPAPNALPGAYGGNVNIEQVGVPGTGKTSVNAVGSSIVGVDLAHFKQRELELPMQLRYGLFDKVQAFIGVPVGWSNTEADLTRLDEFQNDGGIGDLYWGATIQFAAAEADCPYVIGTFVATAPTGGDPFSTADAISPNGPSLGNGFWRLAGNLLFIQPLDPVTFFYGAGIRGSFEHEYLGIDFEPGMEYNYTFGLGFAINEKVTFSTQLFGEYQTRLKANGQGIEGSAQEPISLQIAATIARPCDRFIEPFVQFGLTEDAVAANIGITWTY
jgi:hypothetical protein